MAYRDRQPSQHSRRHQSVRSSNPNVFSDDYALEEYEVAGRRQNNSNNRDHSIGAPITPHRSVSSQHGYDAHSTPIRRSRLSQYSNDQASTYSRADEQASLASRRAGVDPTRTLSTGHPSSRRSASTVVIPRAQSPYQGATGPSHPYGMYPQDPNFSRTPSVATTSTVRRPERSYSGPGGPTQPYGMYDQNTVPEDEDSEEIGPVAPGFPGQRQIFRRRLGPDGEDADDLIGPDGYAEPLPPYTRYANGIPPKQDPDAVNIPPQLPRSEEESSSQEQVHYLPAEYYMPPVEQRSPTTSNPFDDRSAQASSTTAVETIPKDEGGSLKERVKEKSTRKVCFGLMPCWLLIFVVVVLCVAIVLGGIVGGVVAHHRAGQKPAPPPPAPMASESPPPAAPSTAIVTATTVDAVPISTPTGLPALPTGSFNLVLDNPSIVSNACLVQSNQASAWDCPTGANLNITISSGYGNVPSIDLDYEQPPGSQWRYGAQPPELGGMTNLRVVQDRDEWNKGAAYFFMKPYNKTVIVRQSDLPGLTSSKRIVKKSMLEQRSSLWTDAQYAGPNDQPWFCFWNNTILEGFIYVTQDDDSADPSNNAASTDPMPAAASSAAATGYANFARGAPPQPSGSPYPKVVKVEERRPKARISPPYCQQMHIMPDGGLNTVGAPVALDEVEPPMQHLNMNNGGNNQGPPQNSGSGGSPSKVRRQGPNTNCMCEWQN